MSREFLLSICVPTCKREYIVREMLNSIFSQDVDQNLFEVCITDNSETDETKRVIEQEFSGIANLFYKKVTCKGFLNSLEALKFGHGKLLKLHNDYSIFKPGALQKMIDVIKKYETIRPEIFFSMHELKQKNALNEFDSFDEFMYNIGYFSTWSTSFSIWRTDLEALMLTNIKTNYMYPHTTLLYKLTDKKKYVVDDFEYVTNLRPKKKGGYNLVDNFVRIYLTMLENDLLVERYISLETYKKIKNDIIRFVAFWYCEVKHSDNYTFTFENYNKLIKNKCGITGVAKFHIFNIWYVVKYYLRNIVKEKCVRAK